MLAWIYSVEYLTCKNQGCNIPHTSIRPSWEKCIEELNYDIQMGDGDSIVKVTIKKEKND